MQNEVILSTNILHCYAGLLFFSLVKQMTYYYTLSYDCRVLETYTIIFLIVMKEEVFFENMLQ